MCHTHPRLPITVLSGRGNHPTGNKRSVALQEKKNQKFMKELFADEAFYPQNKFVPSMKALPKKKK